MYDYGRPRELHVEPALGVMKLKTAAGKVAPVAMDGFVRLIEQKYFVVDRYDIGPDSEVMIPIAETGCLVGLGGSAVIDGEVDLVAGRAVVVPADCGSVAVESNTAASFVRCWAP
jgi:mannose-6-phosphate isomerase